VLKILNGLLKIIKMKRRKFVQSSMIGTAAVASGFTFTKSNDQTGGKEIIELREYELAFGGSQATLNAYFKEALIPALNKYGVSHVGAFSELGNFEPTKIYLLIPYSGITEYFKIPSRIADDSDYLAASQNYHSLPLNNKVFNRFSTRLMVAFDGLPVLNAGFKGSGLYELRTYEGYNEDAVRRKILMFNQVELEIFRNNELNPVFFGEVIAGPDLPCLTYMVAFKDMEERNKKWEKFGADPDWNRVKVLPEYANTVSKIIKKFLEPLPYSQV
jgi:hypothetical protein